MNANVAYVMAAVRRIVTAAMALGVKMSVAHVARGEGKSFTRIRKFTNLLRGIEEWFDDN